MARKSKKRRGIALPWEGRTARLRGALAGPRWKVLLVVLLVAIAGGLVYRAAEEQSRVRETRMAIVEVHEAVNAFRDEEGRCPERPSELVRPPHSGRRYLREVPRDGWGRRLFIRCPSRFDPESADVVSAGPSGDFFEDDNVQ